VTDTQPASGVDLARAALAAAKAAAKDRPTQPQKKTTRTRRVARTGGRDPLALGSAITGMMTERGWEPPEAGGSILDQWPSIAPELADKVAAVRYEHDTGILHLRPASPAYATQLRMFRTALVRRIHETTGNRAVRDLKILAPGGAGTAAPDPAEPNPAPAAEAPVRTRETASPGYRDTLAVALEHKPDRPPVNPYVEQAMRRQEAALRAGRQPESEHREAVWAEADAAEAAGPEPGSLEASLRAAIAYKRREQAGLTQPRRAFDVA
jgi:predicted nucleic acid-binding Zn ribbon protein